MSYYEWAKANPEKTLEYWKRKRAVKYYKEKLDKALAIVADAERGILSEPNAQLEGLPIRGVVIPVTYPDWRPNLSEDEIIENQKWMFQHELKATIDATRLTIDRFYRPEFDNVERQLKEYTPTLVNWRKRDDVKDEYSNHSQLVPAFIERCFALGQYTIEDEWWQDLQSFSINYSVDLAISCEKCHWVVTVSDPNASFTRVLFDFKEAILYTVITFMDHQWDDLIESRWRGSWEYYD